MPVPQGRLVLQTVRSHDQYNTTIYGLDDRYRGVKGGRRVVFVNPADIAAFGLSDGDRVDLVSEFTDGDGQLQERTAKDFLVVAYSTPVGNAAAYYPETNPLVPLDHTAARSNTPVSKAIVIRLDHTWARVTARRRASHVTAADAVTRPETLVVEEPLEIRVDGKPLTVTMRTPGSDVELAHGFLLTEGVIGHATTCSPCATAGAGRRQHEHLQRARRDARPRRADAPGGHRPATSTRRRRAGCAARHPSTRSARSAATRPAMTPRRFRPRR